MNILDQLKAVADIAADEQRKSDSAERTGKWMEIYFDAVTLRRRLEQRLEEADWPEGLDNLEDIDL